MGHENFAKSIKVGKSDTANNGDITSLLLSFRNFARGRVTIEPNLTKCQRDVINNFFLIATHYDKIEPKIMEMLKEFKQENPEIEVSQRN